MQSVAWLAMLVILLGIELATLGLTTIWFAGGALAAFIVSMLGGSLTLQIVLFIAISLILLIFTRPFAVKYVNKSRVKTNADSLIGRTAVVTETINNLEGTGRAQISGQSWTARASQEETVISEGARVKVLEIRGVKLIVEKEV
ncbi:MAG: NfeD family protein [Lachnospiraceae bacterium]|nr:NfeD family protein [Lachnospiraceae bacterium]MDD3797088.1 NfeD family protein [Lachnospiraceae bacterium]